MTNPAPTEPLHTEILPANSATLCRRGKCRTPCLWGEQECLSTLQHHHIPKVAAVTHLPCILADLQAISHCQKGWRNGFESGHVAVVQWILPISMALHENILPSSLSRARTTCFSRAICSNRPARLMTKPSHVLISNKTVFFQLRGVPIANNTSTIGRWGSKNPRKDEPPKNWGRSPPPGASGYRGCNPRQLVP